MIKEQWQADIVARDRLNALTMISAIANMLYPEMTFARDRERRLLEIPEMQRLAAKCKDAATKLSAELAEWEARRAA
jgi:hypothetical protein